jgi:hypothetical protein
LRFSPISRPTGGRQPKNKSAAVAAASIAAAEVVVVSKVSETAGTATE